MATYSLNDNIIFYPSAMGWDKVKEIIQKKYQFLSKDKVEDFLITRMENGGYKDQAWEILSTFGELFFNSSPYTDKSEITLCNPTY
jgi:hypothetical protein